MPFVVTEGPDSRKFGELLVYIASKCEDDPRFGAVKLNKILFYSDFAAYRRLGRSISGDEYQHLQEGPAPRHLPPIRDGLVREGALEVRPTRYYTMTQKRLVALREADLSEFTAEEIAIVDEVIDELWRLNGSEASSRTHQEIGWRITQESETIPYRTAWWSAEPLSVEQIERGREIAARYGLLEPAAR